MNRYVFSNIKIPSLFPALILMLWHFYDAKLSDVFILKDLGIKDVRALLYVLLALMLLTTITSLLTYATSKEEDKKIAATNTFIILTVNILSVILSYSKLAAETCIYNTSSIDIVVAVASAIFIAFASLALNAEIQADILFIKLRKRILTRHLVSLAIYAATIIGGSYFLLYSFQNSTLESLYVRLSVFAAMFSVIYFMLAPGKKIYDEEHVEKLTTLSETLDYQVQLSERSIETSLDKLQIKNRYQKNTIKEIEKQRSAENKSVFPRFVTTMDLKFTPNGDYFELPQGDDECVGIRIIVMKKKSEEVVDVHEVKYKYLRSAVKTLKRPKAKNDIRGFLEPLAWKALYEQTISEEDENLLLCEFAHLGRLADIKALVGRRNPNINHKDENGWTPLLHAVANGHPQTANYLLQKAADPNACNKIGATPLSFASWYGNLPLCEMLINSGANINAVDYDGMTPLMKAAMRGHGAVVRLLLSNLAGTALKNKNGDDALRIAEKGKFGDIARLLRKTNTTNINAE